MKHLKRIAALALPIALALSVPAPAAAAPTVYTAAQVQAMFQLRDGVVLPDYVANSIGNRMGTGSVAIGVFPRNSNANYTQRLQPGDYTHSAFGWTKVGGWYTGPGYCTYQMRSDDKGRSWRYQKPDLGAGRHPIGATTSYLISAYPVNSDGSCD